VNVQDQRNNCTRAEKTDSVTLFSEQVNLLGTGSKSRPGRLSYAREMVVVKSAFEGNVSVWSQRLTKMFKSQRMIGSSYKRMNRILMIETLVISKKPLNTKLE
jgi:hypothetical protein